MDFFNEIKNKYKIGEPIYNSDLSKYFNTSSQNITNMLTKSVKKGELRRMKRGIYYIPKIEIIYGVEVDNKPSYDTIIEDKYIKNGNKIIGIYGGVYLENMLQLTEQVPATITIITNKEKSNKHIINIAKIDYILRKPYIAINDYNYKAYMVIEAIRRNGILHGKNKKLVKKFICENNISKKKIDELVKYFPYKTQKNYIESEVWDDKNK